MRILLYDLETSPNVGYTWGHYEQNVIKFTREWEILSVGWRWLGGKPAAVKTRADFKDKTDRSLTRHLWELLNGADIVVGHNSLDFDNKKARSRFLFWQLPPPAPWADVDTCKVARSSFKFNSNRLEDLAQHLGLGAKAKTGGFDLWEKAMAGDRTALKKMGRYNLQDVRLLERVYRRLRPYMRRHPNVSQGRPEACPTCGSEKVWNLDVRPARGGGGMYARYRCGACGAVCRSLKAFARWAPGGKKAA